MATRALDVYLDGTLAGTARMSSGGALSFGYDDSYRNLENPTPLSISMPLEESEHKNRVVLPFLQGLLPDNSQALASIATTYSVSAASPFAMLEHIGQDVAGALQFVSAGSTAPDAVGTRARVTALDLGQIEEKLLGAIEQYRDGTPLKQSHGRFSLAGAQPKIALHQTADGGWGIPADATPTTHILKPNAAEMRDFDIVEQLTMGAARMLGLDVAESYITTFGTVSTFVTKRYDRARVGGRWVRLHQEDLCQALGVTPAKKYQRIDGGPGVGDVAQLIESFPVLTDRRAVARDFFAAFVFNVVIGGTDAHAKNYSLLLDGENVRLAPLYDLATFAPYRSEGQVVLLAMSVNGKYRSDSVSSQDLVKVGTRLRLSRDDASEIVEGTRDRAIGAFERARENLVSTDVRTTKVADRVVRAVRGLPLCRQ